MEFKAFKPLVKNLIQYYYFDLVNPTGGYLHIVLDDGNLDDQSIYFCQNECSKNGDTFGYFLATLLREFTEDELQKLYDDDWWGMDD
ncbi:MAG: hypothetical protein ACOH1X_02865 [Kaistella sp.]